jgi:hypothetical protein
VTVVGDAIFAAVIHTSESAKDDWRRHQLGDEVSFEAAELPQEEEQQCSAVLYFDLRARRAAPPQPPRPDDQLPRDAE